jgi:tRNA(Ile)-lysidine synthase
MVHPLESKLAAAWLPAEWADVTVVLAISGGCDSVALLRGMCALSGDGVGRLFAAHVNHQLRPGADADEQFVRELCREMGIACEVGRAAVEQLADRAGDGLEAAARQARYAFLDETASRLGARFVVTAHTADDQAETILHRIVRGTGIRGLSGMARARPLGHATLMRPFLGFRRAELQNYLKKLQQPYRQDESNANLRYTRNRLRHETIPHLREHFNPEVTEALVRLGTLAAESQRVVDELIDDLFCRHVIVEGSEAARIELAGLRGRPPYVVRELLGAVWRRQGWPLQAMGQEKWAELGRFATSNVPGRRTLPGNVTVAVVGETMRLTRNRVV